MKIVRFATDRIVRYGTLEGNRVRALAEPPFRRVRLSDRQYGLGEIRLLAPCQPSKIVAIGLNYRAHAEESSHNLPAEPLLFIKPSTSVINPGDDIVYPGSSERVDYEGELGVVIRRPARRVPVSAAAEYILGYTCFNDVTARDLQKKDGQWTRAKGFDTFAPMGPWIETDLNSGNLQLETRLNGVVKQHSSTSLLIFDVPTLVSFISNVMTLLPGDVIATGTPSGIGPMQRGDTVEVTIDGLGTLKNRVA